MKSQRRFAPAGLRVLALLAAIAVRLLMNMGAYAQTPGNSVAQQAGPPARITQAIDQSNLVTLKGSVHPLARPEFDQGPVSDGQPLQRMLLLLQRSPDQEAALEKLLDDQQNKSSPNYHAWLTPAQFGQEFGPADADIEAITRWLQSHGFQITNVTAGRTVIEFSGNAAQVRNAFHTEMHKYVVNGEARMANASDPQIPAALASVVAGPVSLNNFPRKSYARILGQFRRSIGKPGLEPLFTFPDPFNGKTFYGLGPGDFATIYNSKPLITSGNDGTGQTIAIVGETNISTKDVQQFRQMFGLPPNFNSTNVILNGEDPGITSTGEEGEADLDVEWSGAVAPGATVKLVVSASTPTSAGIDLSALYIVEQNLAGAMSESYGQCEAGLGTAGNAFYSQLWEQAAAQGITVILSAGDGGSAGCDDFGTEQVATLGLAVSGLASTPFNVSVGGTDFDEVDTWGTYWNATNDPTGSSAKSYIPEIPWNENCAQISLTGCGAGAPNGSLNIIAGSGGPSSVYGKPKWQMGVTGMPNDNHRDQPDISLFASAGFNGTGYVYCQTDQTLSGVQACDINNNSNLDFGIVGGTSASAPAFAGIMALVNQYQAAHSGSNRQGNANYVLYALAKQSGASCTSAKTEAAGCVFNDVTKGNSILPTGAAGVGTNSVPCQGGSPDCNASIVGSTGVLVDPSHPTAEAWTATAGYDMTTGLGTVNVNNLATSWGNVSTIPTTSTLTLSPTTGITHGADENVAVAINVKANTGTGAPSGDVSLIATTNNGTEGLVQFTLDANGTVSATTQSLPGGSYTVSAHYAGDGINAPGDSNSVSVTVGTEPSKTFADLLTYDINGNLTNFTASNATYGSGYAIFRVDVGEAAASVSPGGAIASNCSKSISTCPSGTVSLVSSGSPLGTATMPLNSLAYAETRPLAPGNYSVTAIYPGDSSYGPSTVNANFIVSQAPTTLTAGFAGTPVQYGNSEQIAADVLTTSNGVAPTGTFQFLVDGVPVGSPVPVYESNSYFPGGNPPNYAWADASSSTAFTSVGTHNLSAQYSGDSNYAASTSAPTPVPVQQAQPFFNSYGASPNTINLTQQVTLSAQMFGSDKGAVPTGTFAFTDGTTAISGMVTYTSRPATALTGSLLLGTMSYTPTTAGLHNISVSYSGDANYLPAISPTPAPLTVLGPDFVISVSGNGSQTVAAGQTATYTNGVSVSSQDGFSSQVNLSCSIMASATKCSVSPASVANSSGTATVTVTTTSRGLAPPLLFNPRMISWPRLMPVLVIMLLCFLLTRLARTRRQRVVAALPLAGVVLILVLQAVGCGGGSSYTTPPPPPPPSGTPAGTYTITVTGVSTNPNATHTATLQLIVN